jgi:hypothetical protein
VQSAVGFASIYSTIMRLQQVEQQIGSPARAVLGCCRSHCSRALGAMTSRCGLTLWWHIGSSGTGMGSSGRL